MGYEKKKLTGEDRKALGAEIFPPVDCLQLPEVIRCKRLREEVMGDIARNPFMLDKYRAMKPEDREMLMEFFMGNRGLSILYDPFFKRIMNQERLEKLISQIMGQKVEIVQFLPSEMTKQSAEGSVMILDMVVKLADGSYVDLEIQRISVEFPFERAVCYASDLVVKQYEQLKMEQKQDMDRNAKFNYQKIRPIYVIVVMNSGAEKYRNFKENYIHRTADDMVFDTGLKEKAIQRFIFISLDNFRKLRDNGGKEKMTELEAWMSFLASDRPEDITRLVEEYPEFVEMYQEINQFRRKPEEMMGMITEALKILDEGDALLQIERLHERVDDLNGQVDDLNGQVERLQDINRKQTEQYKNDLQKKDDEIEVLKKRLKDLQNKS